MILYNNGCKEAVTKHKKQGRPPKSTYDESLRPEAVAEKENTMPLLKEEKITEPVVNEEPKKLEIPKTIINAVQEKLDAVNKTIFDMTDEMAKLFVVRREMMTWLDEVKEYE